MKNGLGNLGSAHIFSSHSVVYFKCTGKLIDVMSLRIASMTDLTIVMVNLHLGACWPISWMKALFQIMRPSRN